MAPNASLPTLEPNRSASIGIGDRLALELLLGFTGMRTLQIGGGDASIREAISASGAFFANAASAENFHS